MPTREQVYQAFFIQCITPPTPLQALAKGPYVGANPISVWKTTSRRLKDYNNVAAEDQPALFIRQLSEDPQGNDTGKPLKWILHVEVYIYVNVGTDDKTPTSSALNPLIDMVMNNLKPTQGERQTLGGLVYNVRINGKTEIYEGAILAGQAAAMIPVAILTADL